MDESRISAGTVTLLRTKLHMPRLSDDLIERPHLYERLNHGLNRKLTLISAPAGFGKTTLVVAWLRSLQSEDPEIQNRKSKIQNRIAWLSLDKHDNDLPRFLNYFVGAVRTVFPEACPQTTNPELLPQLPPPEIMAATLTNELADLPEDLVLVLDDYHFIKDSKIIHLLTELLHHLPPQMHLIIVTRIDPPLPLAKLRVQRQLTEIRRPQLSFTVDEVQAYLANSMGQCLSKETAVLLQERTEGWGAGLRMVALSMRGQSDSDAFVQSFTGSQHHVMDYLLDEVMRQQPPEVQNFLLQTSIVKRFCAALGAAITGKSIDHSQDIIEWLDQANLFMVPLDDERNWFRYHHLFQEMLNHRLQVQLSQEAIAGLRNSASVWLANQGNIEEALHHALAANNIARSVQLIEQFRHNYLNRENWYAFERLLDAFPAEVEQYYAGLLVSRAWTMVMRLNLPPVPHLLEEAEQCLAQGPSMYTTAERLSLVGEIDAIRGMWGSWQNVDINLIIEHCERAVECIPPEHAFARGIAYGHLGVALQLAGQSETASRLLNKFIDEWPGSGSYSSSAWVSLLYVYFLSGDLNQLAQTSRRLLRLGVEQNRTLSIGFAHYFLGWVNYCWNDLEAAVEHFSAVAGLRYAAHLRALHDSFIGLALAYQAQGLPEQARDALESSTTFFSRANITAFLTETNSFKARLNLLQGDLSTALHWAQTVNLDVWTPTHMSLECPILTKARILVVHGTTASLEEAARLLRERLHEAEAMHNTMRLIDILAILALAYEAQGQPNDALKALERAVSLAQPAGFIRTFIDSDPAMVRLLYQLADRGVAPDYIGRILAAFPDIPTASPAMSVADQAARSELVEPLTRREQEVLQLLSEWHSYQEIAETLVIAPTTVTKHASNIYNKLGVHKRAEAIAKAKSLGLLPSD